jgi:hypothetical protein
MITRLASFAFLGFAAAGAAHAEGFYAGGLLTRASVSIDGISDIKAVAIGAKLGLPLNKYFAVETRLGIGASGAESVSFLNQSVDIKLDSFVGTYGKAILPLADAASVYGLLGYTRGEITASGPGGTFVGSESGVSFGIGADYAITDGASLGIEWARLFSVNGSKLEGLTVGASFKF